MLQHGSSEIPEQESKKSGEQALNRACEACRVSKVRCLANPLPGSTQCQRCAKAGRQCVFAPPAKRRQRKRTDVRVSELEREVQNMRSLLRSNRISPHEGSDHEDSLSEEDEEEEDDEEQPGKGSSSYTQSSASTNTPAPMVWHTNATQPNYDPRDYFGKSESDIIDRGVITKEQADDLLQLYKTDLCHQCPGVIIPGAWTAMELRERKPALFHAVMSAASHSKGVALSSTLHAEAVYYYARTIFIDGEKSVQAIQSLLLAISFYSPPSAPSKLQVYQYANMAASMALELGLASKPRTHEQLPKRAVRALQKISSTEELLENCRTLLWTYIQTAGFAMRLRRPNIMPYNSWMEESFVMLQKSNSINDRRIVAWLKLQRICDETNSAFGFDDASTSISLSELRLRTILKSFDRKMAEWRKSVPDEVITRSMLIEYHQNTMFIWEFAMDGGRFDAPDFRNKHMSLPALDDDSVQPESLLSRSALQINATIKVVSEGQALLDTFLKNTTEELQKTPNVVYVRTLHAMLALLKADYAIGVDADGIGDVLDSDSLKIDHYLGRALHAAEAAVGPQNCRVPGHWLFVITHKLKVWHEEHQVWRREGRYKQKRIKRTALERPSPATTSTSTIMANTPPPKATIETMPHNTSYTSSPAEPKDLPNLPSHPSPSASIHTQHSQHSQVHRSSPARAQQQQPQYHPAPSSHPQPQPQQPPSLPQQRQPQPPPNFGLGNAFAPWPSTGLDIPNDAAAAHPHLQVSSWATDIGDFSSAFQNGDLYLYNEADLWSAPPGPLNYHDGMQYSGVFGTHG